MTDTPNRLHCTTMKVTAKTPEGRLSGFVHVDRDDAGKLVSVAILPSRRIGSLLADWCHEASEALTSAIRERSGR